MVLCLFATALVMVLPRLVLGSRLPKQKGILTFPDLLPVPRRRLHPGTGGADPKFMLLLGQPTRALTVIVFSMLLASGAGAISAAPWSRAWIRRLMLVLAAVAALIALLAVAATPLVRTAATWPMIGRILLAVAMIAPRILHGYAVP